MSLDAVLVAIQTALPVHVIGGPGIGKTSFMQLLARTVRRHLETFIASTHEPSDVNGLPVTREDRVGVSFEPADFVYRILDNEKKGVGSILFMDEISTAPPAMQAGCLRLVHEKIVGNVPLPRDMWIGMASNPTDTSSGTFLLSAAMANRMLHFEWKVNSTEWIEGMVTGFKLDRRLKILPDGWRDAIPSQRGIVASYVQHRQAALYQLPKNAEDQGVAWPSPRTWDMCATLLAAGQSVQLEQDDTNFLMASAVGEKAALEFLEWQKNLDLPDPEELLASKGKIKMPERSDQIFAMLTSVANAAVSRMTKPRWERAWEILGQAAHEKKGDLAAIPAKLLASGRKTGYDIPESVMHFSKILGAAGLLK